MNARLFSLSKTESAVTALSVGIYYCKVVEEKIPLNRSVSAMLSWHVRSSIIVFSVYCNVFHAKLLTVALDQI